MDGSKRLGIMASPSSYFGGVDKPIMEFNKSTTKSVSPEKLEKIKKEAKKKKQNTVLDVMRNPIGTTMGALVGAGKKIVTNIAENIDPYSYDSFDYQSGKDIDVISRFVKAGLLGKKEYNRSRTEQMAKEGRDSFYDKSNEPRTRIDLLNMWAGKPQQFNTLEKSQYTPSIGGNPNTTYLRSRAVESDIINNMFSTDAAKQILSNGIKSEEDLKKLVNESGIAMSGKGKGGTSMTVPGLGQGTIGIGRDNKGIYLSYADVWDIDPTSGASATSKSGIVKKAVSLMQKSGLVSPPNVYGRIYFDPKTGKPILD